MNLIYIFNWVGGEGAYSRMSQETLLHHHMHAHA